MSDNTFFQDEGVESNGYELSYDDNAELQEITVHVYTKFAKQPGSDHGVVFNILSDGRAKQKKVITNFSNVDKLDAVRHKASELITELPMVDDVVY